MRQQGVRGLHALNGDYNPKTFLLGPQLILRSQYASVGLLPAHNASDPPSARNSKHSDLQDRLLLAIKVIALAVSAGVWRPWTDFVRGAETAHSHSTGAGPQAYCAVA